MAIINKTELAKEIAQQVPEPANAIKDILTVFWKSVAEHVKKGDEIRFIGAGKFYKKHTDERTGRNPQTGEEITIAASDKLAFKSAMKLD